MSYLLEILFEKDFVHFVSDSIFKRLNFDYSSSETASNQKIKIKNYFHDDCVFLEIRLTDGNQLLPNLTRNNFKFVQINMKLLLYTRFVFHTICFYRGFGLQSVMSLLFTTTFNTFTNTKII